jgi:hypothetical protein
MKVHALALDRLNALRAQLNRPAGLLNSQGGREPNLLPTPAWPWRNVMHGNGHAREPGPGVAP